MKNIYRKLVKDLNLKPLFSLDELKGDKEVFGLNWSGFFERGIIKGSYVYFEGSKGLGGVRAISKNKAVIEWDGKLVFPLMTVEGELYIK